MIHCFDREVDKMLEKYVVTKKISEKEIVKRLKANAYYYIQYVDLTLEHCLVAVESNGRSLKFIPKAVQTREVCLAAVKQCSEAIKFVKKEFLDDEMYKTAALSDNPSLGYIPKQYLTQEICDLAVSKDPKAIYAVPAEFQSIEMRISAVKRDWRTLDGIEKSKRTKRVCMAAYESNEQAIQFFPNKFITQELCDDAINRNSTIMSLIPEKFRHYEILDNEQNHNFSNNQMKRTDSDKNYFQKNILPYKNLIKFVPSIDNETIKADAIIHEVYESELQKNVRNIYYISDIHLMHKILKRFKNNASKSEIEIYIESIIDKMLSMVNKDDNWWQDNDFLLITGDISFNFEIAQIFYQLLAEKWDGNIIVTLGNHELWNYKYISSKNSTLQYEDIVRKYKKMLNDLGIIFLENELFTLTFDIDNPFGKFLILSENDILSCEKEDLQELCNRSSLIVFGGIGFSGLNNQMNASHGIYRETIISHNKEIELSKKTEKLYHKILDSLSTYRVIIQTHMPFTDWCNDHYHPGWIYLNGHNHKNEFYIGQDKILFADNQIGYKNNNIFLKKFTTSMCYDIFHNREDGIFTITRDEYLDFYRGLNVSINFNRRDGIIKTLKNKGFYMFLFKNKTCIYLLKGGQLKNLKNQDLTYYFNNMYFYSKSIENLLKNFNDCLVSISKFIRQIGGDGTIHGCIVDIDFYNHIYLNPNDGKIVPYYATSIVDKWVYPNIESILKEKCPRLIDNYYRYLEKGHESNNVISVRYKVDLPKYFQNTDIYNFSNFLRSLQYLTELNVIREWDERIFEYGILEELPL